MSSKEKQPKGFLIYYDNEIIVYRLPDDEAGKLFKSLFPYGRENIKPDFESSPALAMAFDILSMAIDSDKKQYYQRCEKNRENIVKRWNKNNTTEYDRIPPITKDTNNNNNSNTNSNNNKDNINYQLIADMYNDTCVSFPKVTKLSDKRKKAIKARMKVYTAEDFRKLFQMAEESSFLKGQNDRNWSATFDWLIADSNMAKVLDGNYKNRQQSGSSNIAAEEQARLSRERYKAECKKYGLDQPIPGSEDIWG